MSFRKEDLDKLRVPKDPAAARAANRERVERERTKSIPSGDLRRESGIVRVNPEVSRLIEILKMRRG